MVKQSASAVVEVAADPETAFRVFTAEIDLWWALTYKERLRQRGYTVGKTYYHEWHGARLGNYELGKLSMLKALNVHVRRQDCSKGFEAAYDTFLTTRLNA